jgi:hypothetical protein
LGGVSFFESEEKCMKKSKSEEESHQQESKDVFGRVMTICALVVSVIALILGIWEGVEARRHNRLSVRPIIQFERIWLPHEPWPQVGIYIANHGTGVALLENVTVYVDGEPVPSGDSGGFAEAARMLILADHPDFPIKFVTSMREAIPPEDVILLFGIDDEDYTEERIAVLRDALSRISMHVEYQSIYNDSYEIDMELP